MRMMITVVNVKERRGTRPRDTCSDSPHYVNWLVVGDPCTARVSFPGSSSGSVEKLLSAVCISLCFLTVDTMRTASMFLLMDCLLY